MLMYRSPSPEIPFPRHLFPDWTDLACLSVDATQSLLEKPPCQEAREYPSVCPISNSLSWTDRMTTRLIEMRKELTVRL